MQGYLPTATFGMFHRRLLFEADIRSSFRNRLTFGRVQPRTINAGPWDKAVVQQNDLERPVSDEAAVRAVTR